ncbi:MULTISPECIES: hypothetical protein [Pseudomonas]|jgi:hypothetical protein|uniref:hypothetical protein n=1 Tax=Pseudomonas TaxID=286 RepID=UPI0018E7BFB6|nr:MULTISPECIES: hypothetical protein [Pseudomonas]MBJ2214071.1 hypothetical protein [Pseudomonas carnis]MBP5947939.1 hypothetical protein [Pseudomonas sp. P9(2020)]
MFIEVFLTLAITCLILMPSAYYLASTFGLAGCLPFMLIPIAIIAYKAIKPTQEVKKK